VKYCCFCSFAVQRLSIGLDVAAVLVRAVAVFGCPSRAFIFSVSSVGRLIRLFDSLHEVELYYFLVFAED
jgi:hypothetical protein